jgi:hypothetical protein
VHDDYAVFSNVNKTFALMPGRLGALFVWLACTRTYSEYMCVAARTVVAPSNNACRVPQVVQSAGPSRASQCKQEARVMCKICAQHPQIPTCAFASGLACHQNECSEASANQHTKPSIMHTPHIASEWCAFGMWGKQYDLTCQRWLVAKDDALA